MVNTGLHVKALGHVGGGRQLCVLPCPLNHQAVQRTGETKAGRVEMLFCSLCSTFEDPCVWYCVSATGLLHPPSLSVFSSVTKGLLPED